MKHSASARGRKLFYSSKQFKISVLILGLVLFSSAGYSQKITLIELISKTKCSDFSCFDDFMTTKGFCYDNTDQSKYGTLYSFNSCDFIADGPKGIRTKNRSSFMIMSTGSISADVGTSSILYRQKLMLELAQLGFKVYETDNSTPIQISVIYKSKIYPKIIATVFTSKAEKDGHYWTYWSFSMRREL